MTELRAVIALQPSDAMAHVVYSQLARDLGDMPGALEASQRAVALQPRSPRLLCCLGEGLTREESVSECAGQQGTVMSKAVSELTKCHRACR